jgi:hypothetical protein
MMQDKRLATICMHESYVIAILGTRRFQGASPRLSHSLGPSFIRAVQLCEQASDFS